MTAPRSLRELFDQLGPQVVESTDNTVVMEMPVDERTTNNAGGLQGGLIATLADVAAGQLASRATPFGTPSHKHVPEALPSETSRETARAR